MPDVDGRIKCCVCGADLGDASDPYRDPDCMDCFMQEEMPWDVGYCFDEEALKT